MGDIAASGGLARTGPNGCGMRMRCPRLDGAREDHTPEAGGDGEDHRGEWARLQCSRARMTQELTVKIVAVQGYCTSKMAS